LTHFKKYFCNFIPKEKIAPLFSLLVALVSLVRKKPEGKLRREAPQLAFWLHLATAIKAILGLVFNLQKCWRTFMDLVLEGQI